MAMVLKRLVGADAQTELVGQASDGEEGLVLGEHLPPDVMTLDVVKLFLYRKRLAA